MLRICAKFALLPLLIVLAIATFAHADGLNSSEVEFTGNVESITVNGQGAGTLFLTLNDIELAVIVNSKTIIQDELDEFLTMKDLAQRNPLKLNIQGKFSSSGILANRIRIVIGTEEDDSDDPFLVQGHVTKIDASGAQISLLGITVFINDETVIKKDGVDITAAEIKIGTKVVIMGSIGAEGWTATQITILTPGHKRERLLFEGLIDSYDSGTGTLGVAVVGATEGTITTVVITGETRVLGTLEEGAYVMVIGTLNPDGSVKAKEVRVLEALEIKPDDLRLEVGETATFTVKLREAASGSPVRVNLSADPSGVLELSAASLVIAPGMKTADFMVTALVVGSATITATIEGTSGSATAKAEVREATGDGNGRKEETVRLFFSPDHIKLRPNDVREVVLRIHPPQKQDVAIVFTNDEGAFAVEPPRLLSNGAAEYKVKIQAGEVPGSYTITASLPEDLGGAVAKLSVEVSSKSK